MLTVSALYPHKRIPYLLHLWKKIIQKNKTLELVLIGKNGRDEKQVLDQIKYLPRTHYYSKIPFSSLVAFYQHASVFVSSSVYEGFGYPVYEAILSGAPCVVGRKELYPESQKGITELSFNVVNDAKKVCELVISQKLRVDVPLYKNQANVLLDVYNI